MKATNANQRVARDIAETRQPNPHVNYRKLREENARRAARANGKLRAAPEPDYTWLMHDIMSTPYAVTRS